MQSVVSEIEKFIKKRIRGKIYFVSDFAAFGSAESVKKSLFRIEKKETLIRLAHGIYLYPKFDKTLNLGVLYPTVEEIAKAIAARDKARIVPTGAYALHALGLSTQVPVNIVYLTDGASRQIKIYKQKILFKNVAPKKLAYKSKLLMLVVSALREIGNGNITEEELQKIKIALLHEKKEVVKADLSLAPVWIRELIEQIL